MQPVFIGDVQGCADELDELVGRIRAAFGPDGYELWFVGDLVNRGPASLRALRCAREHVERGRGRMVLGNHEVALLAVAEGLRTPGELDTFQDVLAAPDLADWVEWLAGLPLVELGRLGDTPVVMVHAALAPDWELGSLRGRLAGPTSRLRAGGESRRALLSAVPGADPDRDLLDFVTRCRSLDADGGWSDADPSAEGDAWHARWSAAGPDYGVVYGHWSMQGLHVTPRLRGLDTGCVHHGRGRDGFLTAWVPDTTLADPFAACDSAVSLWQVRAHRPHYLLLQNARLGGESA